MKKILIAVFTLTSLCASMLAHARIITVSALDSYGPEGDQKKCPVNIGRRYLRNPDAANEECNNGFSVTLPVGKILRNVGIISSDNSIECVTGFNLVKHNTLTDSDTLIGTVSSQDGQNHAPLSIIVNDALQPGEVFVVQAVIVSFNRIGDECRIHGFSYQY